MQNQEIETPDYLEVIDGPEDNRAILIVEAQLLTPTMKRTLYMREYKRRQYANNPDKIKNKNKAYYYKNKFNMTAEELHKYDILLPVVAKIKKNLDELKLKDPEILQILIQEYLNN